MQKTAADNFPRFAELPTEIRLKIWQFWMSPRLVCFPQLSMEKRLYCWKSDNERRHIKTLRPDSDIPLALLGVNKESNSEMSLFYHRSFGFTKYTGDDALAGVTEDIHGVIFNADIDTLFIREKEVQHLINYCTNGFETVRHIAVFDGNRHNGLTMFTFVFPTLGRLFMKCVNLDRLCLCLFDPYGRAINEQDEIYRKAFEASLQNWYWCTFEGKHTGETNNEATRKRWKDVVRVMYISQLRSERGMNRDQRPQFEIDW